MSSAIPYPEILTASLKGVNNAFRKYHKWSNGQWLNMAPESFIQAEIANCLSKKCPYITLEDTIGNLLEDADAESRGPKPRNSASGRMDIIVWWAKDKPRILIEVKKAWKSDALNADAIRLRQLLNRGGSIQKGLLVAYTSAQKPETIDDRFKDLAYNSGTILESRVGPLKRKDDGEVWHWDAGCFSVKV
ncbi:MAG: hypothetical protein O8C64_03750 [Candidatus Methanoperedens sp.]|nr:hypothetical protein [Candidatus Methanoperedens sp.]MCZ7403669.1 hypothetical protein [Candidatus Methanoperedens sp.]